MEASLFINGKWEVGEGEKLKSFSPFNTTLIWEKPSASISQMEKALKAAKKAFYSWRSLSFEKRLSYLQAFIKLLEKNKDQLAITLSKETGKLLFESKQEIQVSISKLSVSIEAYHERTPEKNWEVSGKAFSLFHKPHGVVAIYGPYNFPFHLPNGHILPALLAGNCVVLKPSEYTPCIAEEMAKLWEQTGLPAGVFTLLQGSRTLAKNLSGSPNIQGLFFTGSYPTGRHLASLYAEKLDKILALELGGNNPLIFSNTNNSQAAVVTTINSAYISSGQRCTCARRLIIIKSQEKDYLNQLIKSVSNIKIGKSYDCKEGYMGPLISKEAKEVILKKQKDLLNSGAHALVEAKDLGGAFISPALIDVSGIELDDEEYFGPLLLVKKVENFEQAVWEAKNTSYGLSAGIITQDHGEFTTLKDELAVGILNKNSPTTGASSKAPFGGVGKSGNHRPAAYYAADYCAYPCVCCESDSCELPASLPQGLTL